MSAEQIYESTHEERMAALAVLREAFPGQFTTEEMMSIMAYTETRYHTLETGTVAGVAAAYLLDYMGLRSFIKFVESLNDPDASE
ncbi:hypothetical protein TRFO_35563 [Tritrichomonas foetus]|uniref:Uncharacterized protein n=1 Tax=Tritrichomonas foetus TaxID=1144522 RepID=A0A1J4JG11_9EUKA|nr:hypothetical protein TRFO_35563 [Tritrichomonas foetus]|eukprot:OHS98072.1 hypothetical protein TRFO_35563 [Tritrichomonas foetus]